MKKGFTLVEMMVAIAVFSIVMVVAMSALLNVVDANKKAQAIKTAINNVNFALESISKDMRVGTNYGCIDSSGAVTSTGNCTSGGVGVRYSSPKAYSDPISGIRKYAYYRYNGTDKSIESCLEVEVDDDCGLGGGKTYTPITSQDVDIKSMSFYVTGVQNTLTAAPDKTQPRVIITLTGEAGSQEKIKTSFDLQTSVSQRARGLLITTP